MSSLLKGTMGSSWRMDISSLYIFKEMDKSGLIGAVSIHTEGVLTGHFGMPVNMMRGMVIEHARDKQACTITLGYALHIYVFEVIDMGDGSFFIKGYCIK